MRFFFRKKDHPSPKEPATPYQIKLSGRNYAELEECDVALKFWLSEIVEKKIDEMCSFQDTSASDLIRQILFIHLYGRYDLFGMIERQITTFDLSRRIACEASFALAPRTDFEADETTKPVQKNIADIKVWIPARMKEDLQALAKSAGKKLSVYVREVIITHLFGHVPPDGIRSDIAPHDECEEDMFS